MSKLDKVVVSIDPNGKDYQAIVSYDAGNGLQNAFMLDTETAREAMKLFERVLPLDGIYSWNEEELLDYDYPVKGFEEYQKAEEVYCISPMDGNVEHYFEVEEEKNYCLACSSLYSVFTLINKLLLAISKSSDFISLFAECDGKTFYLNEEELQRDRGVEFSVEDDDTLFELLNLVADLRQKKHNSK